MMMNLVVVEMANELRQWTTNCQAIQPCPVDAAECYNLTDL